MMFTLRPATSADGPVIRELIRRVQINPFGLDWRRFLIAVDEGGRLVGCAQVKVHRDESRELASVAVAEAWRGKGVARALVERLLSEAQPPLWLVCRTALVPLYDRFGFRLAGPDDRLPRTFRLIRRVAGARWAPGGIPELAFMLWEGSKPPSAGT